MDASRDTGDLPMDGCWWLLFYTIYEEEKKNDSSMHCYRPTAHHKKTRFERFLDRHPVIGRNWPYLAGLVLGLAPVTLAMAINVLIFGCDFEVFWPYMAGLAGGILVWALLVFVVDRIS